MDIQRFDEEVEKQLLKCKRVLTKKGMVYSTSDDRLDQFKTLAIAKGSHPVKELGGISSKQLLSIMQKMEVAEFMIPQEFSVFDELITDIINYMLLLKALLKDEEKPKGKKR